MHVVALLAAAALSTVPVLAQNMTTNATAPATGPDPFPSPEAPSDFEDVCCGDCEDMFAWCMGDCVPTAPTGPPDEFCAMYRCESVEDACETYCSPCE